MCFGIFGILAAAIQRTIGEAEPVWRLSPGLRAFKKTL
jgi:hypothetical protein